MRIKSQNLSYYYGDKKSANSYHALNGLDLEIGDGDFFGIVGKTGSGKSTFIQHLNGLIKVKKECGSLAVGEIDLTDKKCDYKKLRKTVGMVFQYPEYQLFAETVHQDVAFGISNFMPEADEEKKAEMVKTALGLVGLDYERVKDKSPFELSGGQKRRVAIAGVIATSPEVLVLDEPITGLDPRGKKEFIDLLHVLHENVCKTVIIVSHDMNIIAENCNQMAVFFGGKVYSKGTPEQVFSDAKALKEIGLELPVSAVIKERLNENGFNISGIKTQEIIDCIIDGLGGRR